MILKYKVKLLVNLSKQKFKSFETRLIDDLAEKA